MFAQLGAQDSQNLSRKIGMSVNIVGGGASRISTQANTLRRSFRRTLAVLWTLFGCLNSLSSVVSIKLLDLSSSMDTYKKLLDLDSSMDTFPTQEQKSSKNCGPQQFYGHLEKNWWTYAVLWTLFQPSRKNSLKTADLSSFMDTFRLSVKSVHKTVGP